MTLSASQRDWLRVRSYLGEHRHALAVDAAGDYPAERRVAGTPLLAAPEWQLAEPVPLHDIELEFIPPPQPAQAGPALGEVVAPLLPERLTGPATGATRTRCGTWPPRRCSKTAPPTG